MIGLLGLFIIAIGICALIASFSQAIGDAVVGLFQYILGPLIRYVIGPVVIFAILFLVVGLIIVAFRQ